VLCSRIPNIHIPVLFPATGGIADDPYNRGTYASTVTISEFQYLMYRPL